MSQSLSKRFILLNDHIKANAAAWVQALEADEKHPWEVLVRIFRDQRSLAQNNCLHGWCQRISDHVEDNHQRALIQWAEVRRAPRLHSHKAPTFQLQAMGRGLMWRYWNERGA